MGSSTPIIRLVRTSYCVFRTLIPSISAALRREALAVPAARKVSVHTPELVAIDDSCELLPCLIAIYGRVHGETLESLELSPPQAGEVWRELGRELARLHAVAPR
jgi:hygromycin-B 7''-O-kinase